MNSRSLEKLAFRAKVARGALVAVFATLALSIALAFGLLAMHELSAAAEATIGITSLLPYLALLVFVVAYFLWLHLAVRNLSESAGEMRFSPGWHVASYFVPLVNLVVPFRAMRELWNRSHGEPPELANSSAGAVASWWACWVTATLLLSAAVLRVLIRAFTNVIVMVPPLLDLATMGLILLLLIGASWFLFGIIGAITRAQTGFVNAGATFA